MNVGFIGLGQMGSGMAANLLEAGHDVTVYNRTPARGEGLAAKGARPAASLSEACRGDAVFTMLADDAAVEKVTWSTLFDAPVYKTYGEMIIGGKFEPAGFAAPLGHKDIRLALAAAESLRVPMPLARLLRDRFLTLLAQGGDRLDWSAIGSLPARDSGKPI